jgi:DNA-binding transcriptional LysR family regulator
LDDNKVSRDRDSGGRRMEWEHLRTFEAVARLGSLTKAAKALGVSQSTVSRHLDRLEASARSPLLLRESPAKLTERGEAVLGSIGQMIEGALAARCALEQSEALSGEVTVTTVGELLRWRLVSRMSSFDALHPQVRVRVLVNNGIHSLAADEADIALRWVRPQRGELVGRRLRVESYALCAARGLRLGPEVAWLGLAGALADIPEQRYAARVFEGRAAKWRVEDLESLGRMVEAGLGVGVLPRRFAARLKEVREVSAQEVGGQAGGALPERALWMVMHQSKQRIPRVRAVSEWLVSCLGEDAAAAGDAWEAVGEGGGLWREGEGA